MTGQSFDLTSLCDALANGSMTAARILDEVYRRIAATGVRPVWITVCPQSEALAQLEQVEQRRRAGAVLPLYGIPFAVKDIIDVAGLPTTAACPAFSAVAERTAPVVARLQEAGAILIGKTNLDQFATGLVGTRSPYGACASVFNQDYIAGGSSSGSAVAVAAGLVSFALGTDTAGSGRVPAAFNNIVGLKPTKGLVSTSGMVAACRTLDCVSVFAGTVGDAIRVLDVIAGYDPEDPYARRAPADSPTALPTPFRFGVPQDALDFFGDPDSPTLFATAVERLRGLGGTPVAIDYRPFRAAARLLYDGPWVAERLASLQARGFTRWDAMDPTVASIIRGAENKSAAAAFDGFYQLATAIRAAEEAWLAMDVLLLPTAGTIYRIDAVAADPIHLNSTLGTYTNFVNLMDLSAVAVPAGFRADGLPFGVTLIGRAFADRAIAGLADALHRRLPGATIGATGVPLPTSDRPIARGAPDRLALAVVGAHLSGQPLNHQLTDGGATLLRTCRTAPGYRLYALPGTAPAKPGLVRDRAGAGLIEVEVWDIGVTHLGRLAAAVAPPLGIGTVTLEDGAMVKGYLSEAEGAAGAADITAFGGWRSWLAARREVAR